MAGWHHRLNGHEFEQAPGDGEGQGSLACYSPWDCKVRHNLATERQIGKLSESHLTHSSPFKEVLHPTSLPTKKKKKKSKNRKHNAIFSSFFTLIHEKLCSQLSWLIAWK